MMKYCLAICLLFTSISAFSALNKWVDAQGKVHYSDSAPADVTVQKIRTSSNTESVESISGVPAQKTLAERDAEWKKSQKAKEEANQKEAKELEAIQIKQKNCESARSNLATYENSPRLATYNANGERSILDENARQQKIDEARKTVSSYCN
jgi:hypothetical protein